MEYLDLFHSHLCQSEIIVKNDAESTHSLTQLNHLALESLRSGAGGFKWKKTKERVTSV